MKTKLTKRSTGFHTLTIIAVVLIQNAVGQSNYASHANNVEYLGKGLPEEATLDGKVSEGKYNKIISNSICLNLLTCKQCRYIWLKKKLKRFVIATFPANYKYLPFNEVHIYERPVSATCNET